MPQEHYVLRCFSCGTFQGHIVKKSKKWECKLCGTKQSLKRNYGKGSGKDCRIQVMRLNELRLSKNNCLNQREGDSFSEIVDDKHDGQQGKEQSKDGKRMISKWEEYLDENAADEKSDDDDSTTDFFFEANDKIKKRRKKISSDVHFKKRKIHGQINIEEMSPKVHEETRDLFSGLGDQEFETCSIREQVSQQTSLPIQIKNKTKFSKYAKYMEEEEDKSDLEIKKSPNIFDFDSTDLDSILKFS